MALTLNTWPATAIALTVTLLVPAAALGQPAPPVTDSEATVERQTEGVTVYEPEFFAPYRPNHAKDMLDRVPGAAGALSNAGGGNLAGDDDRRGLRSQTTQILINGKRLTTKDNSLQDYFERIPAAQVERIEVITGNVWEIDADVGSRVINVVLSETSRIGGTWRTDVVIFNDGQTEPVFSGSISGETGNWSYTLAGETRPRQIPRKEFERFSDASNRPFQESIEERRMESRRYIGRGRVAYDLGEDHQVQVSGFIEDRPLGNWDQTELFTVIDAQGNSSAAGGERFQLTGEDLSYELSGDYTVPLSNTISFKGLFVYSVEDEERTNNDFIFSADPDDLTPAGGDTRDEKATEKILRGTFDWSFTQNHAL